jgi:hypothetical protein
MQGKCLSGAGNNLTWPAYEALQSVLGELESQLAAAGGGDAQGHFLRGCFLRDLGRDEEALGAFQCVLELDPVHVPARLSLAAALRRLGRRLEAQTLSEETVLLCPGDAAAHVHLGNLLSVDAPERARAQFEAALALDPDMPEAHQALCSLYAVGRDAARAARHRERGFAGRASTLLPYRGSAWPVPALLLCSTDGGNLYAEHLLDDRIFQTTRLYVEAFDMDAELPLHRVIVNGIADPDLVAPEALERAAAIASRSGMPIVNDPRAVRESGRVANARRLAHIEGVRVPRTVTFDPAAPPPFPFLLRARGHHMGRFCERIENAEQLARALDRFPRDLLAIEFVDTRADDGTYRKYRVMMLDGRLYPLHLAISCEWKVHYFSSAMSERDEYRAEEARLLAGMPGALGARVMRALQQIASELSLDYGGIDFGIDRSGNVVLFETNAAMTMVLPGPEPIWAYRQASTGRAIAAASAMVQSRAGLPAQSPPRNLAGT